MHLWMLTLSSIAPGILQQLAASGLVVKVRLLNGIRTRVAIQLPVLIAPVLELYAVVVAGLGELAVVYWPGPLIGDPFISESKYDSR